MIKKTLVLLFLLLPATTLSQGLEVDYPGLESESSLAEIIAYLFSLAIGMGVLLVVAMLIYGGFLYLTSLGNPERTRRGIEKISSAIFGLSVLLFFVIVAQVINPGLLVIDPQKPSTLTPPDLIDRPFIENNSEAYLILEENPLGHYLENGVNGPSQREVVFNELLGIKKLIKEEREINPTVIGISGLNKYLRTVSDRCSCDKSEARCADSRMLGVPLGCDGDPCDDIDGEPRRTMEKIKNINEEIIEDLINHRDTVIEQRDDLERRVRRFQELEQRVTDCQPQGVVSAREQMKRYEQFDYFEWNVETKRHREMEITGVGVNPLTFYCSVGGLLLQKEIFPREDLDLFSHIFEAQLRRINCSYEYHIGEITDKVRELTIIQITKMNYLEERLAELILEIQKISELVSTIGVENCNASCACIPNPLVWLTGDPCITVIGRCVGDASPHGGPPEGTDGKDGEIAKRGIEMERLEKEIEIVSDEIKAIMIEISRLLGERVIITEGEDIRETANGSSTGHSTIEGESYLIIEETPTWLKIRDDVGHKTVEENPYHEDNLEEATGWIRKENVKLENTELSRIKEGIWDCHRSEVGESLILLDAERAKGNYQHNKLIIENPHPRNLFCCTLSQESYIEEEDLMLYRDTYYNIIPAESFGVLPNLDILEWNPFQKCVDEWYCEPEIALMEDIDEDDEDLLIINDSVWMAKNANTTTDESVCYDNNASNCGLYGRLYSFNDAQSLCDEGWRLPTSDDFTNLGPIASSLKSEGWGGSNETGFSALPSGRFNGTSFYGIGTETAFWLDDGSARILRSGTDSVISGSPGSDSRLSVRCVKSYNQYNDASYPLQQQLSCMRVRLNDIEERLKEENNGDEFTIGVISYISDHRLYSEEPSCAWVHGQIYPGGCSFENETTYGQKRISPHYGGSGCNDLYRSYAVTFSDIENAEHIISAAKECNPFSYVSYKIPNSYKDEEIKPHIQISIAGAYGCGTN